jgi:hypothetical protein
MGRLSRAALFALGAAGFTGSSDCGSSTGQLYRGFCTDDCSPISTEDAGMEAAADGAPDGATTAATDANGGSDAATSDATTSDAGDVDAAVSAVCVTLYGCPNF